MEKLFIEEGKVWIIFVDIHVLDQGGNMIDASGIASIAALLNTRMPRYEDDQIIRGEWSGKLPISCVPVPCTSVKIGDSILIDPGLDEEYAMDARLTVATTDTINAMQKGGQGTLKEDEILSTIDLSFEKGNEIRKLIQCP